MFQIHSNIPDSMEELISPQYTAVAVVDAQNDFCKEGGALHKFGADLSFFHETIKNIKMLIEEARTVKVPIVYVQNTALPNHASDSPEMIRWYIKTWTHNFKRIPTFTLEGTWGEQIVDELRPVEGDVIIKKNRASGFIHTNLDLILRNKRIRTLVVTGFVTHLCILATVMDGRCRDYFMVVAKDCVNSNRKDMHEIAIKLMESRFDVWASDQIIEVWKKLRR